MTNSNGNRDDELETIRQLLIATARRTESNSESIDQLTDRLDHLTGRVDQVTINVDNLAALMVRFVENAEADRAVVREIQSEVRGIQTENRRIWEYLLWQQRDRNGDEPQV